MAGRSLVSLCLSENEYLIRPDGAGLTASVLKDNKIGAYLFTDGPGDKLISSLFETVVKSDKTFYSNIGCVGITVTLNGNTETVLNDFKVNCLPNSLKLLYETADIYDAVIFRDFHNDFFPKQYSELALGIIKKAKNSIYYGSFCSGIHDSCDKIVTFKEHVSGGIEGKTVSIWGDSVNFFGKNTVKLQGADLRGYGIGDVITCGILKSPETATKMALSYSKRLPKNFLK